MDHNPNSHLPDDTFNDPAKHENDPGHHADKNSDADDDRDIDIRVKHSAELPDGDDVDLDRAE